MTICDGCNVRAGHEHRCHGDRAVVQGDQTGRPCECAGCGPPDPYELELAGVCVLGPMTRTMLEYARAVRALLQTEQEKARPDNALVALLCDAARLGWEYNQAIQPEIGRTAKERAWEFVQKMVMRRFEALGAPGREHELTVTWGQLRDDLAAEFERAAVESRRAALES